MNLHEIAAEAAEKQARNEAETFEKAMIRVISKPECDDLRIEQIAAHYGVTSQVDIAIEECGELIQAVCKFRRGYSEERYTNLLEEIADVYIMARQLRFLFGYEEIDRIVNEKLDRQMRRISDENTD